jgi:hypothetical protein
LISHTSLPCANECPFYTTDRERPEKSGSARMSRDCGRGDTNEPQKAES